MRELKSGDVLRFRQKDGNWLIISVSMNGIGIQAEDPTVELTISRFNSFMINAEPRVILKD